MNGNLAGLNLNETVYIQITLQESTQLNEFLDGYVDYRIPADSTKEFAEFMRKTKIKPILEAAHNDRKAVEIIPGLYLGSIASMIFSQELDSVGITHIVIAAKGIQPFHVTLYSKPQSVDHLIVPVDDFEDEDILKHFDTACKYIKDAIESKGKVLVHWYFLVMNLRSFKGRSRSTSIVIAYLMKEHEMKLNDALQLVKSKRPIAAPNAGFAVQLRCYEYDMRHSQNSMYSSVN